MNTKLAGTKEGLHIVALSRAYMQHLNTKGFIVPAVTRSSLMPSFQNCQYGEKKRWVKEKVDNYPHFCTYSKEWE